MSQLIEAAKSGDLNGVRKHIAEAKKKGPGGWTALMHAVRANNQSCAEILAAHEAGFQDDTGQTALMLAVDQGMSRLIPMLIPKEAGLKNRNGWTALMLATSRGNNEYVKLLLCEAGMQSSKAFNNTPALTSALMIAARWNKAELVNLLKPYEQGLKDEEGHTAFWHAKSKWNTTVIPLLDNEENVRDVPPPIPKGPAVAMSSPMMQMNMHKPSGTPVSVHTKLEMQTYPVRTPPLNAVKHERKIQTSTQADLAWQIEQLKVKLAEKEIENKQLKERLQILSGQLGEDMQDLGEPQLKLQVDALRKENERLKSALAADPHTLKWMEALQRNFHRASMQLVRLLEENEALRKGIIVNEEDSEDEAK